MHTFHVLTTSRDIKAPRVHQFKNLQYSNHKVEKNQSLNRGGCRNLTKIDVTAAPFTARL